ncbi:DUF305 domain-containing protein [Ornithinimicrobium flavum]|uniref:DUF305 domain-containing protein n=1 Tax=Ornithinimicrobium flavum TaxID=1288636 RepID=UPI0010704730|nr:DUF305 domain-containing protein [Ornithinimicrobium flavum]
MTTQDPDGEGPVGTPPEGAAGEPGGGSAAQEAGPTPTAVPVRDRWRSFGAPMLAALIIPTLCLGVLLGWLAFGDRSPGEGSVDAGFARDMSEHHAQATQMSLLVMARSDDEAVQRVAQDIVNNQEFERGMMATWLEDWGLPRARTGERMQWMSGHDHTEMELPAGVPMPGMAAPSEIQALTDATGEEAEVLYLQLMTTHHMSGVEMAQAALDADDPRVRAAAQRMIDTQASEVSLMRDMLADRGAEPREDVDAWLAQARSHGGSGEDGSDDEGSDDGSGSTHEDGH